MYFYEGRNYSFLNIPTSSKNICAFETFRMSNSPLPVVDTIKVFFLIGNFDGLIYKGLVYKKTDLYRLQDKRETEAIDLLLEVFEARGWRKYLERQRSKFKLLYYEIEDIRCDMFYFLHAFSQTDFQRIAAQVMGTRRIQKKDEEDVVRAMEVIKKIECFDAKLDNISGVLKAKEEEIYNKTETYHSRILACPFRSALTLMNHPERAIKMGEK